MKIIRQLFLCSHCFFYISSYIPSLLILTLYKLSDKIYWTTFDTAFSPLYCQDNGRPANPIRLMCGLLILKHIRNLSDESVVEQ